MKKVISILLFSLSFAAAVAAEAPQAAAPICPAVDRQPALQLNPMAGAMPRITSCPGEMCLPGESCGRPGKFQPSCYIITTHCVLSSCTCQQDNRWACTSN